MYPLHGNQMQVQMPHLHLQMHLSTSLNTQDFIFYFKQWLFMKVKQMVYSHASYSHVQLLNMSSISCIRPGSPLRPFPLRCSFVELASFESLLRLCFAGRPLLPRLPGGPSVPLIPSAQTSAIVIIISIRERDYIRNEMLKEIFKQLKLVIFQSGKILDIIISLKSITMCSTGLERFDTFRLN